ncbi:MAG TPA: AbrB/MazE/SpoVT family DNA-binding domain-containing protein [Clostridia bacterium]|nr:AbrB/MazE/SpoVT family DNA-binding domain-containing protein [Clostridia bacterium]
MAAIRLIKWGNSQGIRIPKNVLKKLNLNTDNLEDQKIKFHLEVKDGQLLLSPMEEKSKLEELFLHFDGNPEDYKTSISWGEPVGKEVW